MRRSASIFLLCSGLALSANAAAGTTLNFVNHDNEAGQVQAQGGMVRAQQSEDAGIYMLFDQAKQELTVVNKGSKTYQRITEDRIEQVSKKIADAKAKLLANFDSMPPDQQARLQPLIERMAVAEARQQRIEKGSKDKVGGVSCRQYQVFENDKLDQTLCAASAKSLKIDKGDYAAIAGMLTMLAELSNKMAGGMMQTAIRPQDIDGIPVRTEKQESKKRTELSNIERVDLDKKLFEVPASYKETQAP